MDAPETRGIALPFDKDKQWAVLGHLLTNRSFFLAAGPKIAPEWFADPYAGKVAERLRAWHEKNRTSPSPEELQNSLEVMTWEPRDRNHFREAVRLATHHAGNYRLEPLAAELTSWYHSQAYFRAVTRSSQLYNLHKDGEAYDLIQKVADEIRWTTFESDAEEKFDSWEADFADAAEEYRVGALTFGLKEFDRLLTPKAARGSLLKGDTSIVLAPVNVGKSTSLINTLVPNLLQGRSVLWVTHEGRPSDLKEKLWCRLLKVTPQQLLGGVHPVTGERIPALAESAEGRRKLELASALLSRFLTYVPMNKAGLAVEEVVGSIRNRQEKRLATSGKGYDLLVDDYPQILTTRQAQGGNLQTRNIHDVVYRHFVQLGLEYRIKDDFESGFHVLLAIQTNREGARVNKGQRGTERLLTSEDVNEAFGPIQAATNVWTINRSPEAMAAKRLTYYIDKSRSSETGWAVVCRTDYARATTHSDELGCTYYRGASSHEDRIDDLLGKFGGKGGIPDAMLSG